MSRALREKQTTEPSIVQGLQPYAVLSSPLHKHAACKLHDDHLGSALGGEEGEVKDQRTIIESLSRVTHSLEGWDLSAPEAFIDLSQLKLH